jgi:hypothetical protein
MSQEAQDARPTTLLRRETAPFLLAPASKLHFLNVVVVGGSFWFSVLAFLPEMTKDSASHQRWELQTTQQKGTLE